MPNRPALAHFDGTTVKLAVRRQGEKPRTTCGKLRVEQGDLTSTWMPVKLDDPPRQYTCNVAVDPSPG